MRAALLTCALILVSCDPVNQITVRFPIAPASSVTAYWVHRYEGRSYAQGVVFEGETAGPEFSITRSECCGTAAAYRDRELWFIACVESPGSDPVLLCGRPGDPPAQLVRTTRHGSSCKAIAAEIRSADIAIATCTLTAR